MLEGESRFVVLKVYMRRFGIVFRVIYYICKSGKLISRPP
jgi:hypothetical protein